ncbi:hypothetical protein [Stutzerimonas chloritidismutans]|uniref:Attachment protein n=1 Tax=Stutzerimonas chloritidismutans TaxID=203192 RepID=A0ABU9M6L5_STUCH
MSKDGSPYSSNATYKYLKSNKISEVQFNCRYQIVRTSDGFVINPDTGNGNATRSGDTCTGTYNPSTGVCEKPQEDPCKSTTGTLINHWHKEGDLNKDGTIVNRKGQPSSLCQGSCLYDIPASDGCYTYRTAAPSGIFCSYSYRGVGTTCVASSESPEATTPPATPKPVTETKKECTNKVTDGEGRVHYTCTDTTKYQDPGSMNCGEINGVYDCRKKASGNDPKYTQKDAKKEVTEDVKIDGSKVTDTTTTTTTTTCSGVGACSTTNTTNKNTNVTNADGSSGGESGSCTGDNCGKGDADGNGVPDGDEGEEEEGGSPDVNEFPKPGEKGNFDDTSADFDTKIEALKTELGTKAQEIGDLFGLAGDLSLGSGGGDLYCDGSVEILGQTIDFCLDDYRNQLNYIALAVLFVCALVSLFIVFR